MQEQSLNTNFSTLILLFLREYRIKNGVHQAHVAASIGKTPSALSKIESGASALNTNTLFGMCHGLSISPSYAISVIERLIPLLANMGGYYVNSIDIESGEDDLMPKINEYFNSVGFKVINPAEWVPLQFILNPYYGFVMPTAIRYLTDENFKKWFDSGAVGMSPMLSYQSLS